MDMLFSANIFSKEACDKTLMKTTRLVMSCIFNVVALLKAIDSKAGSLNDTAVSEYASIEDELEEVKATREDGKWPVGILQKRHYITRARAMSSSIDFLGPSTSLQLQARVWTGIW